TAGGLGLLSEDKNGPAGHRKYSHLQTGRRLSTRISLSCLRLELGGATSIRRYVTREARVRAYSLVADCVLCTVAALKAYCPGGGWSGGRDMTGLCHAFGLSRRCGGTTITAKLLASVAITAWLGRQASTPEHCFSVDRLGFRDSL